MKFSDLSEEAKEWVAEHHSVRLYGRSFLREFNLFSERPLTLSVALEFASDEMAYGFVVLENGITTIFRQEFERPFSNLHGGVLILNMADIALDRLPYFPRKVDWKNEGF